MKKVGWDQGYFLKNTVSKPEIYKNVEGGKTVMKTVQLSKEEKKIEKALIHGEYRPVARKEFERIAQALKQRKKDAVLNIRVNGEDLKRLKQKSKKLGIAYQTFISEILHRFAA